MSRLASALAWATVGLVVLVAAGPSLVRLMNAAVTLVIVVGVVVAALRVVFYRTRGW